MDTALIGLVGIIAGALLTGGVSAALAVSHRRTEARVAALVLRSAITEALSRSAGMRSSQTTGIGTDWETALLTPWFEQRQAFARVATADQFTVVAVAFSSVASLLNLRQEIIESTDDPISPEDQAMLLETFGERFERALPILAERCFTWGERRRMERNPALKPEILRSRHGAPIGT